MRKQCRHFAFHSDMNISLQLNCIQCKFSVEMCLVIAVWLLLQLCMTVFCPSGIDIDSLCSGWCQQAVGWPRSWQNEQLSNNAFVNFRGYLPQDLTEPVKTGTRQNRLKFLLADTFEVQLTPWNTCDNLLGSSSCFDRLKSYCSIKTVRRDSHCILFIRLESFFRSVDTTTEKQPNWKHRFYANL